MKESKRQKQFSSLIQKDLSEIFQRNGASLVGSHTFITVTRVDMSADLSVARIYLSFMLSDKQQELMDMVNMKKGEVRRQLGNRIGKQVRVVPELIFLLDDSADHAARIDKILSDLNIPPEEGDSSNDAHE
ncbi:30S ribosome-binding factor RbfA [Catalinimonas niigatensis]|uniref:30S ribosome-binding factor RbfA n=1 Tax=Catalinimonas niigatensis TaxID=1397264 RepID=UPI0026650D1A|nr:30S ribosome-binding factor RbfA [Catalinimonas niigatensis]WPP53514.1 30S ribosome-binding factor RbfA [Catalinimonas niigatensis]